MTAQKLITKAAVFIMIKNDQNQVLLQLRKNTGYLDGYYDFACSGHVDDGESLHEAAVRELMEELGIKTNADDLKLIHINQNYIDHPYINFTFMLDTWEGTPQIKEPEKCADLAYFDIDELPQQCTLNVRVNERAGFQESLSYSKVMKDEYEAILGAAG